MSQQPIQSDALAALRVQIDALDKQLLQLVNDRAGYGQAAHSRVKDANRCAAHLAKCRRGSSPDIEAIHAQESQKCKENLRNYLIDPCPTCG